MSRTVGKQIQIKGNYFRDAVTLSSGATHDVDPGTSDTGAVELHAFAVENAVDITLVVQDNLGNDQQTVLIESFSDSGISQQNQVEISDQNNTLLRLENTSNNTADYIVTGVEVSE
jgi:hypothetical protein